MDTRRQTLAATLRTMLGHRLLALESSQHEILLSLGNWEWPEAAWVLREHPGLSFTQCVNIFGQDASVREDDWLGRRFSVTYELRSARLSHCLRVQVFAEDDNFPEIESVTGVWPSACSHEQRILDRLGIEFPGQQEQRGNRMVPASVQSKRRIRWSSERPSVLQRKPVQDGFDGITAAQATWRSIKLLRSRQERPETSNLAAIQPGTNPALIPL